MEQAGYRCLNGHTLQFEATLLNDGGAASQRCPVCGALAIPDDDEPDINRESASSIDTRNGRPRPRSRAPRNRTMTRDWF